MQLDYFTSGFHNVSDNTTVNKEEEGDCQHPFLFKANDVWIILNSLFCSCGFIVLFVSIMFWVRFRHLPYLAKRSIWVVVFLSLGFLSTLITGSCSRSFLNNPNIFTSCISMNFFQALVASSFLSSQFVGLVLFHFQMLYNRALSDSFKRSSVLSSNRAQNSKKMLTRLKYLASRQFSRHFSIGLLVLCFLSALSFTLFSCPQMGLTNKCTINSVLNTASLYTVYLPLLIFVMALIYISIKCATYPDPFSILYQTKMSIMLGVPPLVLSLVVIFIDPGNFEDSDAITSAKKEYLFDWIVLVDITMLLFYLHGVAYQVYRATRFDIVHDIDSACSLKVVLENPVGKQFLRQHLVNEFSIENLNFYEAVTAYKKLFHECNRSGGALQRFRSFNQSALSLSDTGISRANVAKNIFFRYFPSTNSIFPGEETSINVSSDVVERIRSRLSETMEPPEDLYDEAAAAVFNLIEHDSFGRFKRTKAYKQFIGLSNLGSRISL